MQYMFFRFLKDFSFGFLKLETGGRVMKVWDASTSISAEFGGIRDLSRHLSLNYFLRRNFDVNYLYPTTSVCHLHREF